MRKTEMARKIQQQWLTSGRYEREYAIGIVFHSPHPYQYSLDATLANVSVQQKSRNLLHLPQAAGVVHIRSWERCKKVFSFFHKTKNKPIILWSCTLESTEILSLCVA